jgi:hypothetical protein
VEPAWEYQDYKIDLRIFHGTKLMREPLSTPYQVTKYNILDYIRLQDRPADIPWDQAHAGATQYTISGDDIQYFGYIGYKTCGYSMGQSSCGSHSAHHIRLQGTIFGIILGYKIDLRIFHGTKLMREPLSTPYRITKYNILDYIRLQY